MKNILILASGATAKAFVHRVSKSRIDDNRYYITCPQNSELCSISLDNISIIKEDPTSYLKLKNIMKERDFSTIFIVIDIKENALQVLKNIRMIDAKILVVFVHQWEDVVIDDENVSIVKTNEVIAGSLYEKLPNVPIIAKNIGLGHGEIMEVLVPFGSSFAYRHVGSIAHRKWKIVAMYRKEKQIFPNSATMILPNDRLIMIGNPIVLEGVYKKINKRQGAFPEPFGRNLYLILDMRRSREDILVQINEAIFLSKQLSKTKLYIRLLYINSLNFLQELRDFENQHVFMLPSYNDKEVFQDIDYDMSQRDIGLFLLDNKMLFYKNYKAYLYELNRPIYLFGNKSLYNINEAVILMGDEIEMESLSSSVFDFSESLGLGLSLCDYNPEGDFEDNNNIIEHYESLSRLYNFKINIDQKRVNPIRELLKQEEVLHILPFSKSMKNLSFINFLSTEVSHYFLSIKKHPQLLIPIDN
jgi:hypothetical protein